LSDCANLTKLAKSIILAIFSHVKFSLLLQQQKSNSFVVCLSASMQTIYFKSWQRQQLTPRLTTTIKLCLSVANAGGTRSRIWYQKLVQNRARLFGASFWHPLPETFKTQPTAQFWCKKLGQVYGKSFWYQILERVSPPQESKLL